MHAAGMVNVGELARERHGLADVVLVGFAGHRGSVVAATSWGAPTQRLPVPEAPADSHEDLLHRAIAADALVVFDDRHSAWLAERRGHRAIGVVYRPGAERRGNWVPTVLGRRYDALLYFDETTALRPLHGEPAQPDREWETYPWSA
jgi:erythromycin esterase-like protein